MQGSEAVLLCCAALSWISEWARSSGTMHDLLVGNLISRGAARVSFRMESRVRVGEHAGVLCNIYISLPNLESNQFIARRRTPGSKDSFSKLSPEML